MYSLKHKVTYSEISADKHISIAQAVRYFQDTSTFQSEAVGDSIEELEKKQCAWLLSAWQLEVDRYPVFGEELTIFMLSWPILATTIEPDFAAKDVVPLMAVAVPRDLPSMP